MTSQALLVYSTGLAITPDVFPSDGGTQRLPDPDPSHHQSLTLAEAVEHEAMGYRARGTPTGDFLARQMERLAQLVRWTGAVTPEDHETRMEVWDEEIREQWYDRGYHEGHEAGRRDGYRAGRADWDRAAGEGASRPPLFLFEGTHRPFHDGADRD